MINIGIIGCGYISYYYCQQLSNYNTISLIGVYDKIHSRSDKLGKRFECKVFNTMEDLLQSPTIELVLNLTNPQVHYEINKQILLSNKHLYSEKPITLSLKEFDELVKISIQYNLCILSAPGNILSNYYCCLKDNIHKIGKIHKIEANIIEYKIHKNQYEAIQNGIQIPFPIQNELDIGCNLEHIGYILTPLVDLFGEINHIFKNVHHLSEKVKMFGDKLFTSNTPDSYETILSFNNHIKAYIKTSINGDHCDRSMKIYGEKGIITIKNLWDYNSFIFMNQSGKNKQIQYSPESFQCEWVLNMNLMRIIAYYDRFRISPITISQLRNILSTMLQIQQSTYSYSI